MHLYPVFFIYLQIVLVLQFSGSEVQAACADGLYCPASSNYAIDCALALQCPVNTDHVPEQIVVPAMIYVASNRAVAVLSDNRVISWGSGLVEYSHQWDSTEKNVTDVCVFGYMSILILFHDGTIYLHSSNPVYSSDTGGGLVSKITCGSHTACVFTTDGTLMCLGEQWNEPMLGLGHYNDVYAFETVPVPAGKTVLQISLAQMYSCAILSDNKVYCWGAGWVSVTNSREDTGSIPNTPIPLGPATMIAHSIRAFERCACGIFSDPANGIVNRVKCWGSEVYAYMDYNLGTPPSTTLKYIDFGTVNQDGITPYQVLNVQNKCVLLHTHEVKCWGKGGHFPYETLGYENTNSHGLVAGTMGDNLPVIDLGSGVTVKELAVSIMNTGAKCVLTNDGKVKCWGYTIVSLPLPPNNNIYGDEAGEMGDNLPYVDVGFNTLSSDCACKCTNTQTVWVDAQCKCPQYLTLDAEQNCVDVDECLTGQHNCHTDAKCTNCDANTACGTADSFICTCNQGWAAAPATVPGTVCLDFDACGLSMSVTAEHTGTTYNLAGLTDGIIENDVWETNGAYFSNVNSCAAVATILMDLGAMRQVNGIIYYPYYDDGRSYCSQSITVSATGAFAGEQTVLFSCSTYNDCGPETSAGRTAPIAVPIATRYVRLQMSRNTINGGIHFLEAIIDYTDWTKQCDAFATCMDTVGPSMCACNTGYLGNGTMCTPCAADSWCPDATTSYSCPLNTYSPPQSYTQEQCLCKLGYYYGTGGGVLCQECRVDHWCPGGGQIYECPPNSTSIHVLADSVLDCKCEAGFENTNTDTTTAPICSSCKTGQYCAGAFKKKCV